MIDRFNAGRYTVPVAYLDNHLLGVVKPPNLPVQADASGDPDLLTAGKAYIGEKYGKPGKVYLGLVHRLDRPAGGCMVFARTSKAAARLSEAFASHTADKRYLAVLQGEMGDPAQMIDYLIKDEKTGTSRVVSADTPGCKRAELRCEPIAARDGLTLAAVALMTGRAHQIRVQHAHAGFPLYGDARYGGGAPGEQLALWAWRLAVPHPTLHTPVVLSAPPPDAGIWTAFRDELEAYCHG